MGNAVSERERIYLTVNIQANRLFLFIFGFEFHCILPLMKPSTVPRLFTLKLFSIRNVFVCVSVCLSPGLTASKIGPVLCSTSSHWNSSSACDFTPQLVIYSSHLAWKRCLARICIFKNCWFRFISTRWGDISAFSRKCFIQKKLG